MEYRMKLHDAIRMAAWAHDKVLRDLIVERAVKKYKETGEKLDYVVFDGENEAFKIAKRVFDEHIEEERKLSETARLNNIGIACEKAGDIESAIAAYEECAAIGYPAEHCYERLRIIYKKRKDFANMQRAIDMKFKAYSSQAQ